MLKVSVKGSQDGGWGLTQSCMEKGKAAYHEAADKWRARHKPRTILCFVQLEVPLNELPKVYLATPDKSLTFLKRQPKGAVIRSCISTRNGPLELTVPERRSAFPRVGCFQRNASKLFSQRPNVAAECGIAWSFVSSMLEAFRPCHLNSTRWVASITRGDGTCIFSTTVIIDDMR